MEEERQEVELLESILIAASIARNIAYECRNAKELKELLIETKKDNQANPRFVEDFKTLADVLIQEVVKKRLIYQFPLLNDHIHGEESNVFTNILGESIVVQIKDTQEETTLLLSKVLNNNIEAAYLLSKAVHGKVTTDIHLQISECLNLNIPVNNLGVWIDPIDSTAEYIKGDTEYNQIIRNITISGLQCVTVLIGVFDRTNGKPVMGVIDQPFFDGANGRRLWGVHYNDKKIFFNPQKVSTDEDCCESKVICISSSEDIHVKTKLKDAGYTLVECAGAGYKLLNVILGYADAYILSKPTTYKWDTCAPHAILNSLNGGIVDYHSVLSSNNHNDQQYTDYQINYSLTTEKTKESSITYWCNNGGIIAYRNHFFLSKLIKILA